MKSKKVFRTWKLLEDLFSRKEDESYIVEVIKSNWPLECEGKTEEECEALGFQIHKDWLVKEAY